VTVGRPTRRGLLTGGAAVLAISIAIAIEATTFDVAFPTDPLGPKAFPFVAALLLGFGGAALIREGRAAAEAAAATHTGPAAATDTGPAAATPTGAAGPAAPPTRRVILAAGSFILYALLLAPLGFVVATTAEFVALVRLFGGPWVRGTAAGALFAVLLYGLFVHGLGLPLPLGILAR